MDYHMLSINKIPNLIIYNPHKYKMLLGFGWHVPKKVNIF